MKTKRLVFTGAVVTVALLGCSSFNRYTYPNAVFALPGGGAQAHAATPPAPPPGVPDNCIFRMPELGSAPELPLDQLAQIDPYDSNSIDNIQQRHIEELRRYIMTTRRKMESAVRSHQLSCAMNVTIG